MSGRQAAAAAALFGTLVAGPMVGVVALTATAQTPPTSDSSDVVSPGVPGAFTGPGATGAQGCTVRPDPTNGRGCLTPRMAALALQLKAQGWRLSCWDEHAWNPRSNHPKGRACDVFPGRGGVLPTGAERARGDALAASLIASRAATGVSGLIWYGRDWSPRQGWTSYSGGGVYNPADITGGHFDHLHVDVIP